MCDLHYEKLLSRKPKHTGLQHITDLEFVQTLRVSLLSPCPTWPNIFFQLFKIEINSVTANDLKLIEMMEMQCVTIYSNINDFMKIHPDRFLTFYGQFANEAR